MQRLYDYNSTAVDITDDDLEHSGYPADSKVVGDALKSFKVNTPEMHGAIGDGVTDDTTAIQQALDAKGVITFTSGKVYLVTSVLRIAKNTIVELNGATIQTTSGHLFFNFLPTDTDFTGYNGNGNIVIRNGNIIGGNCSFAHGDGILLDNVHFSNCINDHFLEICACRNYVIKDCSFIGMTAATSSVEEYINIDPCMYGAFPWLPQGSDFYDETVNDGIIIRDSVFGLSASPNDHGYDAIGTHGNGNVVPKHKNIYLIGNQIDGFTGCGIRANHWDGVYIFGNSISVTGDGIRVGDVVRSENVTIKANVITASGTAITKANNSTVFQSADNDINPTYS